MTFVVAIDGPAAAGKGTISKAVAAHFGFAHLDTGLIYRAVGAKVLDGMEPVAAARSLVEADFAGDHLRRPEVAQAASRVAVIGDVRQALIAFQREFAARDGGAVLDGRDIGTVICPDAAIKLFVTASAEKRAGRRLAELNGKGHALAFEQVLQDVRARDARDSGRADAPMRAAADAVLLDTTDMTAQEAIDQAIALVAAAAG